MKEEQDAAPPPSRNRWQRRLLMVAALGLGIWLVFFDSYSLVKRFVWHSEASSLSQENAHLRAETERLEATLEAGLSDEDVEHIAREQYGMRAPDETVHRVEED